MLSYNHVSHFTGSPGILKQVLIEVEPGLVEIPKMPRRFNCYLAKRRKADVIR